jgi:hypothetical protein
MKKFLHLFFLLDDRTLIAIGIFLSNGNAG